MKAKCKIKLKLSSFPKNWFDEEKKKLVNALGKELRNDPYCAQKRRKYWKENYKKQIKIRKVTSVVLHSHLINLRTSHQREFWKVIAKTTATTSQSILLTWLNIFVN